MAGEGLDLRPLHRMTVDFLRAALLMKSGVKDALDLSKEAQTELSFVASRVSMEHILRALRLFGQVSLKFDQPSPLPLELATVELGLEPEQARPVLPDPPPAQPASAPRAGLPQPPRSSAPPPARSAQAAPRPQAPSQPASGSNGAHAIPRQPVPVPDVDPSAPPDQRIAALWPALLKAMGRLPRRRFDVAALLRSSSERRIEDNALVVRFSHHSHTERVEQELEDPRCRKAVDDAIHQVFGEEFSLRIEAADKASMGPRGGDLPGHLVRAAMSLGGQVVPHTDHDDYDGAHTTTQPPEEPPF